MAGGAFFAYWRGVPQIIWSSDASRMTSVIAGILIFAAVMLGLKAWKEDRDAGLGHLLERLAVMTGMCGTAIGLSMQAQSLAGGATSLGALATSLFTTASGIVAAVLIALMTYNLERPR